VVLGVLLVGIFMFLPFALTYKESLAAIARDLSPVSSCAVPFHNISANASAYDSPSSQQGWEPSVYASNFSFRLEEDLRLSSLSDRLTNGEARRWLLLNRALRCLNTIAFAYVAYFSAGCGIFGRAWALGRNLHLFLVFSIGHYAMLMLYYWNFWLPVPMVERSVANWLFNFLYIWGLTYIFTVIVMMRPAGVPWRNLKRSLVPALQFALPGVAGIFAGMKCLNIYYSVESTQIRTVVRVFVVSTVKELWFHTQSKAAGNFDVHSASLRAFALLPGIMWITSVGHCMQLGAQSLTSALLMGVLMSGMEIIDSCYLVTGKTTTHAWIRRGNTSFRRMRACVTAPRIHAEPQADASLEGTRSAHPRLYSPSTVGADVAAESAGPNGPPEAGDSDGGDSGVRAADVAEAEVPGPSESDRESDSMAAAAAGSPKRPRKRDLLVASTRSLASARSWHSFKTLQASLSSSLSSSFYRCRVFLFISHTVYAWSEF
jgi:hypothetical protein